jgi:hypothetical protein
MASRAIRKMLMKGEHLSLGFDADKGQHKDRDTEALDRRLALEEMTRSIATPGQLRYKWG